MTVSADTIAAPVVAPEISTPPTSRSTRVTMPPKARKATLTAIPLVALLLAWHLLTTYQVVLWLRFDKIPTPTAVFESFRTQLGTASYYRDIVSSTRRILVGFGLATVSGVLIGMAVGRSAVVSALVRPVLEVFRPIPAIALVPLAILLFPTGEQGIVFITFFAAFFPVAVSTIHAMHALPRVWEEAAHTLGARRRDILFQIALPGALPGIFSGLSVAMGVAWICVISAEMISGQFGIGYFTWQSYGLLDYPGVIVGMLTIGLLGWFTAWLVELAGRRVNRWLPRAQR
ncbi:ABC transporter permease [Nocardia rhizosphaerihabitans]|uniref:Nitrate ABC transporter, permease protein n=1 Tax=Nocardia rhizosphaerihabitans TaxID=1691570 RepID=A0ABQ2KTM8_9NOCA|nr:ABC transporter permease [Nocardia rhizosphaerihabitans]GGN92851.1 putative nitrate ABC transporter, permease protein [Nocardia rhizosphaerihabitans]